MSFKNSRRVNLEIKLNEFTYSQLNSEQRELALNAAIEIKARERAIWENILAIGNKLIEVKQALGHGHFTGWIQKEFEWHINYADRFMKIANELGNSHDRVNLSGMRMTALYQLAAGLSNSESEYEKTALLNKVEERTEEKRKPLTEAELKAIRAEIEAEYRNKQEDLFRQIQKANCQVDDAKYKMEMIDRERAVLKLEAANAKKFKQQYEETYQEKRLTENHLRSTTKKLEETERQLERFQKELENEKHKAVKEYINQHLAELEQKKADLELEIEWKQAEIVQKNEELSQFKNSKIDEVMLRQMLAKFAEITAELSENQFNLINVEADYVPEFKGIIVQLKTWVAILEDAISEG